VRDIQSGFRGGPVKSPVLRNACAAPGDSGPDRYEYFLNLFARDRERIFAYIFSLLPHHADAEDVFQRCSILLWRKIDQFERDGSFYAWAVGVAFYEVRNFLRVADRDRLQFDLDLIDQLAARRVESLEGDDDRAAALRQCLEKLKRGERELLEQVYGDERSVKEMAEASGRAPQTLYNQLSQIRRRLFHCMGQNLAREGGAT
jgi:RNA polymerase sigma-70 factor (ECF subfamily)